MNLVVAANSGIAIQTIGDISNLIGVSYNADGLILSESDLPAEFFDLRTGFAGELFQKLSNYQIRTALILQDFDAYGKRFSELAYEHQTHGMVRFVRSMEEATAWLGA